MNSILVGYDLDKPGQDYQNLFAAIQAYDNFWHCLDSTWIIKTDQTTAQVRVNLQQHIDQNDKLLVVRLVRDASWIGFDDACSNWLQNNL